MLALFVKQDKIYIYIYINPPHPPPPPTHPLMLMYMKIIFGMQMIYMWHTDDLISENWASKLQEQIFGTLFHFFIWNSQSIHVRKIWGILNWDKKEFSNVCSTFCPPLRHVCISKRDHLFWQWLVTYAVLSHCVNKYWLFIYLTSRLWINWYKKFPCRKWIWKCHLQNVRHFTKVIMG